MQRRRNTSLPCLSWEGACASERPGRLPCLAGLGAGRLCRARRGPAAEVQDRPVQDDSGAERDRLRADRGAAAGRRIHLGIRPDLVYANGKVPPVDVIHLHHGVWLNVVGRTRPASPAGAVLRARRGEDGLDLPKGYGYAYKTERPLAPQLHDPQPHARTPPRSCMVVRASTSSPRARRRPRRITPGTPDLDGRANGEALPGLRRRRRARAATARYTYPDDDADAVRGRTEARTSGRSIATAC